VSDVTLAPLSNVDIGAGASIVIAFAAYRAKSLTRGGAVAAVVVGTATYGALGLPGAVVLLAFFVTSVGLSRVGRTRKRERLVDVGKTGARDAAQVLANGGIAAACALVTLFGHMRFEAAFAGAFAAAAADTWGTEIGTLVRGAPRSILTLRRIPTGLSGGVTLAGSLAEVAGALAVAAAAMTIDRRLFALVAIAGIAGALADSVLGASVQTLRYCPQCKRPTEREPHGCGANTEIVRGWSAIGNDAVNFAATFTGAVVAYALVPYFSSR
jgi:uncharacterized protein (TIGR00297 family)